TQFKSDLPQLGETMDGTQQTAGLQAGTGATALPQTESAPARPTASRPQQPTALPQADNRPNSQTPTRPSVGGAGQTQTAAADADRSRPVATAETGQAPTVFADVVQGTAPQSFPQVAMQAPSRLSTPSAIEVITPEEATAGIRRDGPSQQSASGTQVAGVSDQVVVISRDSARSGSVASSGFSMTAPSVEGESSSGIRLSGLQPSSTPRPTTSVQGIGAVQQPRQDQDQPTIVETGPSVFTEAPVQVASLEVVDQIVGMRRPANSVGLSNVEFVAAAILEEPNAQRTTSQLDADSAPKPNGILGVSDTLAMVEAEQVQGLSLPNRFQLAPNREPAIELASVQPTADLFQRKAEPESHTTITLSQDVQEVETPREAFLVGNPDFIIERNDDEDTLPTVADRAQEETFEPVETASLNLNTTAPGPSAPKPVIDVAVGSASNTISLPTNEVPFALPSA
ncbi:MAG: hypothetical protein AAGA78_13385, partial [Pseudomonadota bacterium]